MRYITLVLLFSFWTTNLVGQVALQTREQVLEYQALTTETIFVHTNTSFLLTGEYLLYKVYCFDNVRSDLTKFSKVAYVELLGEDGEQIFKHKILLREGQGQGDFFIPTDVASGAYKLVAYTNWMRNQHQDDYYQNDVVIVNPYRSNQPELQNDKPTQADSLVKIGKDTVLKSLSVHGVEETKVPIQIDVNGTTFSKRAKVVLSVQSHGTNDIISGHYSISVRKKDLIRQPLTITNAAVLVKDERQKDNVVIGDNIVLPELRGEHFQGRVIALADGKSVKNLKIGVSIPGEDYVLEVVQTDNTGIFHVNVPKIYSGEKMVLQVLSKNPEAYKVSMVEPNILNHTKLDFKEIELNATMREEILQRSIHNQIENSYFQFRPDSVVSVSPKHFLDNKPKKTYLLDDFTRFKTLRETFVEIIQDVSSKKISSEHYAIRVKGYDYATVTDIPPLILLDGCLIQDHGALLAFDARSLEAIHVFRQQFIFGPEIYEGAIILTSKEGNAFERIQYVEGISTYDLLKPQPTKKYFMQRYERVTDKAGVKERLPDDRIQLLWMPQPNLNRDNNQIDFFTSDVSGEFEISLEGITKENTLVSIRKSIFVE